MALIIVSNRAPVSVVSEGGTYRYDNSSGGLASGLRAYVERVSKKKDAPEITWLGWPGSTVPENDKNKVRKELLKQFKVHSVFLPEDTMERFYQGFCNKTIWPLFHYFPSLAMYEKENWEEYVEVNRIYCEALLRIAKRNDTIWIHDYHLMLLPAMLRKKMPEAEIGFFLHIPFPSYEVFRLLPSEWRRQIFEGMYGADLIGFHTHDYRTYFLRSTLRIMGLHNHMGEVFYDNRLVKVDTFPMGIDYRKYHSAALSTKVLKEKELLRKTIPGKKIILSLDRQDYSKGILHRLRGYDHFLKNHPEWVEKIILMMIIVPSRIGVESYQAIKSQIDELVGSINGKYGNFEWVPIHYQYRSLSFTELIALYSASDVALVTPLRDGMNLIAKEYIASRTDNSGALILSEMAGAADELAESIVINPNTEEIGDAIYEALHADEKKQARNLRVMQERLKTYDVFRWADDFLSQLKSIKKKQERLRARMITKPQRRKIITAFKRADSRILFLDYDGTLVPFVNHPEDASPDKKLMHVLEKLTSTKNTEVIIISGRDRHTLKEWFSHLPVNLVGEHGIWLKEKNHAWRLLKPVRSNWKKKIIPIMNHFAERLPGSYVEEKEYSVVFHYRRSEPVFASLRVKELVNHLMSFTTNLDIQMLNSNHALEMRNAGSDKGVAALHWLSKIKKNNHFILAAGDDWTDEDLFRTMPPEAFTIKIGQQSTYALINIAKQDDLVNLLNDLKA